MSANNGVIRIGRKGLKKFVFGEEGAPFEVDVVVAFQQWLTLDETFREQFEPDAEGLHIIPSAAMQQYHEMAVEFVSGLAHNTHTPPGRPIPPILVLTTAEALDFIARLRECYDELTVFFRVKSREKQDSPDTSEAKVELRFSPMEEIPSTKDGSD